MLGDSCGSGWQLKGFSSVLDMCTVSSGGGVPGTFLELCVLVTCQTHVLNSCQSCVCSLSVYTILIHVVPAWP